MLALCTENGLCKGLNVCINIYIRKQDLFDWEKMMALSIDNVIVHYTGSGCLQTCMEISMHNR